MCFVCMLILLCLLDVTTEVVGATVREAAGTGDAVDVTALTGVLEVVTGVAILVSEDITYCLSICWL